MSFIKMLQVAFIVLKLCGVINWSWLWVTAPFWGSTLFVMIFGEIKVFVNSEVIVNRNEEEEER